MSQLFSNIVLGKYIPANSPLHRLDPRTKLLAALTIMVAALQLDSFVPLLLCALFVLATVYISRLPPRAVFGNLRGFAWLFLFTAVLHALLTPGTPLLHLPYLGHTVTAEGLHSGLFFSARLALVITIAALMTLSTSPLELTSALEKLMGPLRRFGLPAGELAMMVTIALRFIPVLIEEAERIYKAQLARGADFGGGPLQRLKSLVPLLIPLFVSAMERADRLAIAMESRCYRSGAERTHFRQLRFGHLDLSACLILLATMTILFVAPHALTHLDLLWSTTPSE